MRVLWKRNNKLAVRTWNEFPAFLLLRYGCYLTQTVPCYGHFMVSCLLVHLTTPF